jgi:hypothetical protein
MRNDKLGFLDYLLLIVLLGLMIISTSCTKESINDQFIIPQMELDARLPQDSNGYYHLKINTSTHQTIHRIDGTLDDITEPTKVSFTSNLNWIYVATGESVPTINPASWATPDDPNISTVIAPIRNHIGDTLVIDATIRDWNIIQTISIVLE